MSRNYRTYIPEQSLLMPPSLRDWLVEDHLSYFISDAVDAMDLSAFEGRYGSEGPGNQAYDARMMVKMGTVGVDGTKMRANASKRKAMSYERMKK